MLIRRVWVLAVFLASSWVSALAAQDFDSEFEDDSFAEESPAQPESSVESAEGLSAPRGPREPLIVPPPPETVTGYGGARYEAPETGTPSDDPDVRIPSRLATRLRVLDGSLTALAARGSGIIDGVLSIVSGGLSVGLGVYIHRRDPGEKYLASYLYLWGGANIARGIIDLALRPRAQRPAIQFSHLPMGNLDEVEARLQFGEQALEALAGRARLARILDASISIGAGAAVIPLYLGPNDFRFDEPFDYFVVIGSGISVITGIINLATRTDYERRWNAYQELRDRLTADEDVALLPPEVEGLDFQGATVSPRRGGATLDVAATF